MPGRYPPKVYIVDDDEAVRFAISMLIESCGWVAESYASAREFLEAFKASQEPGCLVLDLNMPDMNGADLVDELMATSNWLPIIILTGFPTSLAGRVRLAGVRAVLKKPFNDQLLLGHIRQALELSA